MSKVAGGDGNLFDAEPGYQKLNDDLGVEYKVIRVLGKGNRHEQPAAIRSIAGVIFRKMLAQDRIFNPGEDTVADLFIDRHPSGARPAFL